MSEIKEVRVQFDHRHILFASVDDALYFAAGIGRITRTRSVFDRVYAQVYPGEVGDYARYADNAEFSRVLKTTVLSDGTILQEALNKKFKF